MFFYYFCNMTEETPTPKPAESSEPAKENEEVKTYKLPHVANEAIITLPVSGAYLSRCQNVLLALSEKLGQEEITASFARFKENKFEPKDLDEAILWLITSLVASVEKSASEQGKVTEVEVTAEQAAVIFNKKPSFI